MAAAVVNGFLDRLARGMAAEALADRTDAQLLARLRAGSDPAGFAAVVRRHGPMVWASAAASCATSTTPRTPSRPRSSSWPATGRGVRRASRAGRPGCTGSPSGPPCGPGSASDNRRRAERQVTPARSGPSRRPGLGRACGGPGRGAGRAARAVRGCRWSCATWRAGRRTRRPGNSAGRGSPCGGGWMRVGPRWAAGSPAAGSARPPSPPPLSPTA